MVLGGSALLVLAAAMIAFVWAWNGPPRIDMLAMWADRSLGEKEAADGEALLERGKNVRGAILRTLGDGPDALAAKPQVIARSTVQGRAGVALDHLSYPLADGDQGVALMGYPDAGKPPRGLVIALHQTTDVGMKEPMGIAGEHDLAYGDALLSSGFAVIAPDAFPAGERAPPAERWLTDAFYKQHPNWSAMGKMLADNEEALTVGIEEYSRRYGSPPTCIGAVGHSLGAHNALFLAAFDERVKATLANSGFERIASDTEPTRWARDRGFIYMPALTRATRGQEPLPWDWEDVLVQIYPRSLMIAQGLEDPGFTNEISVAQTARAVESAYKTGKHAERFEAHLWPGGHAFPRKFQTGAGDWIEAQCRQAG